MLAALLAGTAGAAGPSFRDVAPDAYYSEAVREMSAAGAVSGYADGTFRPANPVTNAEALKIVCTFAGIAYQGYTKVTSPWYSDVVTWAQAHEIAPEDLDPAASATREQICSYIAGIYRLDTTATTSHVFADTTSSVANALYDAGVITGIPQKDGTVIFGGSQKVKRCDICIMLLHLQDKQAKPDWSAQTAYSLDLRHYAVTLPKTFTTFGELVQAMSYAYLHAPVEVKFQLRMPAARINVMASIVNAQKFAQFQYSDYASMLYSTNMMITRSFDRSGAETDNCTIRLTGYDYNTGKSISDSETRREVHAFEFLCRRQVAELYESGALTGSMSVRDKADVLCKFVHDELSYDYTYQNYTIYQAAAKKTVVCSGYTAYYTYLCNLAGVPARGMTDSDGIDHAWTQIWSDGTWYNVDTTFIDRDSASGYDYMHNLYFWKTNEEIQASDQQANDGTRKFDIDSLTYAFS